MTSMRISVLVATADRPDLLAGCLASLVASAGVDAEVLVLDQSRDSTRSRAALPKNPPIPVRYFLCPRRGKSAALNVGISEARGKLLAFTDDDCLAEPDWLRCIDRCCGEEGDGAALSGRVVAGDPEGNGIKAPSLREDETGYTYRQPGFRDVLFGNNMAIPAELMRAVGPLDETLGPGTAWRAAEDNDLGYRLLRAGIPIRYVPEMRVVHRSWRTSPQQVGLFRSYGLGQGAFYGKHARQGDLLLWARMARNLWDAARDMGGAMLLLRPYHVKTSGAFAAGLLKGFFESLLAASRSLRGGEGLEKH